MAVAIPHKDTVFHSDTIIIGHAQLNAVHKRGKVYWALPGGGHTQSKPFAMEYARRLNTMIQTNMKRFNRSLLWS